jgi:hypothetical protein
MMTTKARGPPSTISPRFEEASVRAGSDWDISGWLLHQNWLRRLPARPRPCNNATPYFAETRLPVRRPCGRSLVVDVAH